MVLWHQEELLYGNHGANQRHWCLGLKTESMQITFKGIEGCDEVYMDVLKSICGKTEGKSMVDLCSNLRPHTPKLGFNERLYVDVIYREVEDGEQDKFIQADAIEFLDGQRRCFDVGILSDAIEHFTKKRGEELIYVVEKKCHRIIYFTPLGEYMVDESDNPEGHHSGWMPEDVSDYASIVFPHYHTTLGIGAFFFFKCGNLESEFERVHNELKTKRWYNQ